MDEIRWMGEFGLDFIDLTLEPPRAHARSLDVERVKAAIQERGLKVVGHTAYYLPIGSPFEHLRRAAVEEIRMCLRVFAQLGARCVNLHPDGHAPFCGRQFSIDRNLQSIRDLMPTASELGICLMIENLPEGFNTVLELSPLLEGAPELGLHLDIGHANLRTTHNLTFELVGVFRDRIRHVHLHDNKGGLADLHLPLGAGTLDITGCIRTLREHGYDGTITLEVFSEDRAYLAHSRDQLRAIWEKHAHLAQRPESAYPQSNLVPARG